MCRFHTQTAGVSLTAQQPYNNVVRTALQALAGVLGGTQSLHTNSLDEALALPTEEAVTIALRTQQIIAHESGVVNTADPLGGSYFVEKLTNDIEAEALEYFRKIDAMGGMVAAVERGFPQREIQEAAFQFQQAVERKEKIIVGVNEYVMDEKPFPILYIDETVGDEQVARVAALKTRARQREGGRRRSPHLQQAARGTEQHHVPDPRVRPRLRHPGRDVRRPARGLGRVRGSPDFLMTTAGMRRTVRRHRRSACSSPSPGWTDTTAGRRWSRARCATPAWRSSTPACARAPEQIVAAAAQEDVDAIGLSILSGAHLPICRKVIELLQREGHGGRPGLRGRHHPRAGHPRAEGDGRGRGVPARGVHAWT